MKRIGKFEKVSFTQFQTDWVDTFGENNCSQEEIQRIYSRIRLPERATKGSAGYDFFSPLKICLNPYETIKIPTGIRVFMEEGWVLKCYPRSSLGFKYRAQFDNTVGIIDQDYYYGNNEGHIFVKLTNMSLNEKILEISEEQGFMQGIFVEYGITFDDAAEGIRKGGIGSSDRIAENYNKER